MKYIDALDVCGLATAPTWQGHYEDWYAVVQELRYLTTYFYNTDMPRFVEGWKAWMDANPALTQLRPEENAAFDAFIKRIKAAKPAGLRPIFRDLLMWMDSYQGTL
jgi:hypothetical protein